MGNKQETREGEGSAQEYLDKTKTFNLERSKKRWKRAKIGGQVVASFALAIQLGSLFYNSMFNSYSSEPRDKLKKVEQALEHTEEMGESLEKISSFFFANDVFVGGIEDNLESYESRLSDLKSKIKKSPEYIAWKRARTSTIEWSVYPIIVVLPSIAFAMFASKKRDKLDN